jgi:hypothetical protein
VAKMDEQGNINIILVGKHIVKRPFRRLMLGWVLILRWDVQKWALGKKAEACSMAGHSI